MSISRRSFVATLASAPLVSLLESLVCALTVVPVTATDDEVYV